MEIVGYFRCKISGSKNLYNFLKYTLCRKADGSLGWISKSSRDDHLCKPYDFTLPDGHFLIRDLTPEEGGRPYYGSQFSYKDTDLENHINED